MTYDTDICFDSSRSNLGRLGAALHSLQARPLLPDSDLPAHIDADVLASRDHFDLTSDAGDFDCTDFGAEEFQRLQQNARGVDLRGMIVKMAALDDLITMKRVAGRPNDIADLSILEALRAVIGERAAKESNQGQGR